MVICVAHRVNLANSSEPIKQDQPDAGHDLFNTFWILSLTSKHYTELTVVSCVCLFIGNVIEDAPECRIDLAVNGKSAKSFSIRAHGHERTHKHTHSEIPMNKNIYVFIHSYEAKQEIKKKIEFRDRLLEVGEAWTLNNLPRTVPADMGRERAR